MVSSPAVAAAPPLAGLSRDQLVAASSGWLAVYLNLHGFGLGYVYQRRWRAFWLGGLAALAVGSAFGVAAGFAGAAMGEGRADRSEVTIVAAMGGFYAGLFGVAIGTSVEAGLAVNRARRRLQGPLAV